MISQTITNICNELKFTKNMCLYLIFQRGTSLSLVFPKLYTLCDNSFVGNNKLIFYDIPRNLVFQEVSKKIISFTKLTR